MGLFFETGGCFSKQGVDFLKNASTLVAALHVGDVGIRLRVSEAPRKGDLLRGPSYPEGGTSRS